MDVDFEPAMHIAFYSTSPNARTECCRFHFGQAWWRHIQKVGLDVVGTWYGLKYTFPQHNLQKHYIYHYLEHHSLCPQQRHLQPGQVVKKATQRT
jgi:hypothetical protein